MTFDLVVSMVLALFVVGALGGIVLRRRDVAQGVGLGIIVVAGIGLTLSIWVVAMGNPWQDGGTVAHYQMDHVPPVPLSTSLGVIAFGLVLMGPLPLGLVLGNVYAFRLDRRGWLRLGVSIAVAACVYVSSFWMLIVALS